MRSIKKLSLIFLVLILSLSLFGGCNEYGIEPNGTNGHSEITTESGTDGITDESESVSGSQTELPSESETEIDVSDFEDPYINMSVEEFYASYSPADSYVDAYYRSLHGFMSGELTVPDQAPTLSEYQPTENGLFIRNSDTNYTDPNSYVVVDARGQYVMTVYRGGAYITLEEVAAYVYAFGEVPANYVNDKKTDPDDSVWGEYLRLNNSYFSGNTQKYPYEPVLPDISGCGGDISYYEIDIGTTGTDCDPSYTAAIYNNGHKITRGAARIVYTRYDKNNNKIIDPNEKYVFYTYNHYNDFQEYLNYFGGWGEMFGNITGGGTISSKTHYNPTPYVETVRRSFTEMKTRTEIHIYYYFDRKYFDSFIAA